MNLAMLTDNVVWAIIAGILVVVGFTIYTPYSLTDIAAFILAHRDAREFCKERQKVWKAHLEETKTTE